jgi:hypothetical protein
MPQVLHSSDLESIIVLIEEAIAYFELQADPLQWFTSVRPATQEAGIRRIKV